MYAVALHYVAVVVSHIQRIYCQPEKTTSHGGQSRSWSAELGKENKNMTSGSAPPPLPPPLPSCREDIKKSNTKGAYNNENKKNE